MRKIWYSLVFVSSILFLTSCEEIRNIEPGFKAKILTPTGYEKGIKSAGQVDIGQTDNGKGNSLVKLEATTVTVKESFYKEDDNNDRRVRTIDGTPLSVDIYIQISLPETEEGQDETFNSVTPNQVKDNNRVYIIKLSDVYNQFAKMIIRGKVREIFAKYNSANDIMKNYDKVNAEIGKMVIDVIKISKTPISLISVQLSNVQEDKIILASKNKINEAQNEADAIEKIGAALQKYPQYLESQKIKAYSEAATKASAVTFMISDNKNQQYSIPTK